MIMLKRTGLFCLLLLSFFGYNQNVTLSSQFSVGGTGDEWMLKVNNNNIGQGWICGFSNSGVSGNHTATNYGLFDFWISKLDFNLHPVWDKSYGGTGMETLPASLVFENKVIIGGSSDSPISGNKTSGSFGASDIWLIALDTVGNELWQFTYGGDAGEGDLSLSQYSDSSFLLLCSSESGITGNKTSLNIGNADLWLIEIAYSDGHIIRQRSAGSTGVDGYNDIHVLANGNILLACSSMTGTSGDKTSNGFGGLDLWLVELDSNFGIVRNQCFGGSADELVTDCIFEKDNDLYLVTTTYSLPSGTIVNPTFSNGMYKDVWILKLNQNWNVIWEKSFGGSLDESTPNLSFLGTDKFYLTSSSNSVISTGNKTVASYGQNDIWGLLIDTSGSILAQKSFGGTLDDQGNLYPYKGDTLILVASSKSAMGGNKTVSTNGLMDAWVGLVDFSTLLTLNETMLTNSIHVYPNPSSDWIYFENPSIHSFQVYNELGQFVEIIQDGNSLKLKNPERGIYFISFFNENRELLVITRFVQL